MSPDCLFRFPNIFSHRPPLVNPFRVYLNAQGQSEFTELPTGCRFVVIELTARIFVVDRTVGSGMVKNKIPVLLESEYLRGGRDPIEESLIS